MPNVDLLRKAAAKLREMAKGTTGAPWAAVDGTLYPRWILGTPDEPDYAPDVAKVYSDDEDALQVSDADWQWMAFANPALAEPLAAWLEEEYVWASERHSSLCYQGKNGEGCGCFAKQLAIARAILGEPKDGADHG